MSRVSQKRLSVKEFFALPSPADGSKQELVRGEVITMSPPGFEHGEVQGNVAFLIKLFLKNHPIGRLATESGIVTEKDPGTVRGPDVSFFSRERMPPDCRVIDYPSVAPDLCVEIVSPSNTRKSLREKILEYFACGVRMVWLIDPEDRSVTIYREPIEGRVLNEGAILDGGDVLPGFQCPVTELFRV